ncbi:hypothetical protein DFH09DRAFT_1146416 [Mycena vulgaris]|nr:hypothetical protein DFH09DRAFT_1146416 [Mycena vulgaris]
MPSFLSLSLFLLPLLQPVLGEVSVGLFVPAIAKNDKITDTQKFLEGAIPLVKNENQTIQWFGVKFTDVNPPTFAIFDTFDSEDGRNTHLNGKVAGALFDNADTLFVADPIVNKANVLASKVQNGDGSLTEGLSVGLRVNFTAKGDKVQDVRDFLVGALPLVEAEPDTLFWYAIEFPGTNVFAIVDFFKAESGRDAHLKGKVAAALFASADELLTGQPDIVKFDVVSANVKSEAGEDSGDKEMDMSDQKDMSKEMGMGKEIDMGEDKGMSGYEQNSQQGLSTEARCQELCKSLVNMLREKGSDCKKED